MFDEQKNVCDFRKGSQCNLLSCTSTTLSSQKVEEAVNPTEEEVEKREPEKSVEQVEKTTEENGEKYTKEEKQNWYMVVYKDSEEVVKEAAPKARPKVMAVKYGIPRPETLAKMRAKAAAKKKSQEKRKIDRRMKK